MSGFRAAELDRGQFVLWSHSLDDAIPSDHPVRLFHQLLHSSIFADTFREMEQVYDRMEGAPPYHPRDLAGLYLWGLLVGARSSRKLEDACDNRLDVRWLLRCQQPDHSTIAAFVTRHRPDLRALSRDVLEVGIRAKLVKLEHTSIDGTKVEADAGRDSVRSEAKITSWLGHLDEKIAALEAEWAENEKREQAQALWPTAPSTRAEDPKRQLASLQRKQAQLKQALAQIARRRQEAAPSSVPPKAIASSTDPDCRCMRDKEGRSKPNYNAQIAVDVEAGMIVAEAVNDHPGDQGQLAPMLKAVEDQCGRLPAMASADSGYNSGAELAALETMGVVGYLPDAGEGEPERDASPPSERSDPASSPSLAAEAVQTIREGKESTEPQWASLPRDGKGLLTREAFVYDSEQDQYRCPAGQVLSLTVVASSQRSGGKVERRRYGFEGGKHDPPPPCATCARAGSCCRDPARGRRIERDQYEEYRERLRARMRAAEGRSVYARRRETVEPRFGYIKQALGVRRFLRRGLEKVQAEWTLVCTAVNVGILLRHGSRVMEVL